MKLHLVKCIWRIFLSRNFIWRRSAMPTMAAPVAMIFSNGLTSTHFLNYVIDTTKILKRFVWSLLMYNQHTKLYSQWIPRPCITSTGRRPRWAWLGRGRSSSPWPPPRPGSGSGRRTLGPCSRYSWRWWSPGGEISRKNDQICMHKIYQGWIL